MVDKGFVSVGMSFCVLGWTVVPSELRYSDGTPVRNDWNRVMTTAFNGASNIVQAGGLACLDDQGLAEINSLIDYYLENARLLRETFQVIPAKKIVCGMEISDSVFITNAIYDSYIYTYTHTYYVCAFPWVQVCKFQVQDEVFKST